VPQLAVVMMPCEGNGREYGGIACMHACATWHGLYMICREFMASSHDHSPEPYQPFRVWLLGVWICSLGGAWEAL
jgi:hypothetical protein